MTQKLHHYTCKYCLRRCQCNGSWQWRTWRCVPCRAWYELEGGELLITELIAFYKNKGYILWINQRSNSAELSEKSKSIKVFKPIPNITPQNFQSKLKTIITFL